MIFNILLSVTIIYFFRVKSVESQAKYKTEKFTMFSQRSIPPMMLFALFIQESDYFIYFIFHSGSSSFRGSLISSFSFEAIWGAIFI